MIHIQKGRSLVLTSTTLKCEGGVLLSMLFRMAKIAVLAALFYIVSMLVFSKQKAKEVIFAPLNASQGNWEVSKHGGFEDCLFTGEKGITLHGWFFQAKKSANPVILWCQSSVGNLSLHFDRIKLLQQAGFDVFIFDYRGYGKSKGTPSEDGWYADALAAYQFLVSKKGIAADHIVIFGQSLGGAVAIRLASQNMTASALVVEGTPISLRTLIKDKTRLDWPKNFLPIHFSCDAIAQVKIPTLIIHGRDDQTVPYRHAEWLLQQSGAARKELFAVDKGGHLDCYQVKGIAYFNKLYDFVHNKQ